ncbi:MAG: AraC family transcriptional regulator [Prevotella sp.]|nr:AraC family transcriptional regulator [Prevotella sp.]
MLTRTPKNYIVILLFAVLAFAACTNRDRSKEATALSDELQNLAISNMDKALERVDSAEDAGVFTAVRANTVKACIYENADRRRMAAYYAEKAIAAEAGHVISTSADSSDYCAARCILADNAYDNGEYGKSIALAKEVLDFSVHGTSPQTLAMKCRALAQMADCESELNHIGEAERLFLQSIDILMESTQQATGFSDIDPLFYTLLALNDLYLDNKMADKALPLLAKMDTAMNRLTQCPDIVDWVVQMRRNNVTISKAMVYAANGQHEQAEVLFHEHQQSPDLNVSDKTAEGVYLTIMGRYDEAIHLFDEADSIIHISGDLVTNIYVKTLLKYKYDALQKAGRTAEALALNDQMWQMTDSIRQQEWQADVEQLQEIKSQEEEIIRKRQSLTTHRIFLVVTVVLLLMAIYIIWRVHRYSRRLAEKNRQLYERIRQQEHHEEETLETLAAQPAETLSQNQQLYRRLCELMKQSDVYTDADTNHETLARLLGTNYQYVYAALRECADTTPADFLNLHRIRHAAKLLSTTDDSVGLIIEMSGITNRSTFNRLFREHYSMSPSEYRKASKQS